MSRPVSIRERPLNEAWSQTSGGPADGQLSRLEAEVAFGQLLARFAKIELLDDAPEYRPNPILRGLRRLELVLS